MEVSVTKKRTGGKIPSVPKHLSKNDLQPADWLIGSRKRYAGQSQYHENGMSMLTLTIAHGGVNYV